MESLYLKFVEKLINFFYASETDEALHVLQLRLRNHNAHHLCENVGIVLRSSEQMESIKSLGFVALEDGLVNICPLLQHT